MKPIKRRINYKTVFGQCIYQSDQGVRVYQNLFYRWLRFDSDIIQSMISRKNPQKIHLNYVTPMLLALKHHPGNCLLLGLGGAAIAHAAYPYLSKYKILAIERNREVIQVAKRYFYVDKLPNLSIQEQAAEEFISQNKDTYSHILVDLANAHTFPPECCHEVFFEHCFQKLAPGGYLAINLGRTIVQKKVLGYLRLKFSYATLCLPVKNTANMVIFASQTKTTRDLFNLLYQQNLKPKQLLWDPEWGYMAALD